ncbi:MAG: type II secretion system protein [Phycisphaerae bacterium]
MQRTTPDIPTRSHAGGFTLIELLIVVAIIALLVSILLPSLARAKDQARRLLCLTNLRNMSTATQTYAADNNDQYPIAYYTEAVGDVLTSYAWDFTTIRDRSTRSVDVMPGLLWHGQGDSRVQQCPSFDGGHNWTADPYTGYNYNTSYVGHGQKEGIVAPARLDDVRSPVDCALFGDGEYSGGANKFMRSPFPSDSDAGFTARSAGTQGFRHLGTTCVAWADGHAGWLDQRHTETIPSQVDSIADGTGFLSADNSAYDLE